MAKKIILSLLMLQVVNYANILNSGDQRQDNYQPLLPVTLRPSTRSWLPSKKAIDRCLYFTAGAVIAAFLFTAVSTCSDMRSECHKCIELVRRLDSKQPE